MNILMKILFLSYQNSCRSKIAEAVLKRCDKSLEIYSAGIYPAEEVNGLAIEVLGEIGIKFASASPKHYSEYEHVEFDFLITVGDGTPEEIEIPSTIKYKRKMHLGFSNPIKKYRDPHILLENCREVRDEINNEIEYFYHRILKKQMLPN